MRDCCRREVSCESEIRLRDECSRQSWWYLWWCDTDRWSCTHWTAHLRLRICQMSIVICSTSLQCSMLTQSSVSDHYLQLLSLPELQKKLPEHIRQRALYFWLNLENYYEKVSSTLCMTADSSTDNCMHRRCRERRDSVRANVLTSSKECVHRVLSFLPQSLTDHRFTQWLVWAMNWSA